MDEQTASQSPKGIVAANALPVGPASIVFLFAFVVWSFIGVLAVRSWAGVPEYDLDLTAFVRLTTLGLTAGLSLLCLSPKNTAAVILSLGALVIYAPAFLNGMLLNVVVFGLLAVCLVRIWRQSARESPARWSSTAPIVTALLFSANAGLNNYGWFGANPMLVEQTLVGFTHVDTLYHVSLAQSLGARGLVSTGLDGFAEFGYHVLSHRLIYGLSLWTGISPLQAYGYFFPLVGYPLLFAGLLRMWGELLPSKTGLRSWLTPLALVVFFGAIDWRSYFGSESYLIALIALFAAVPLLCRNVRDGTALLLVSALLVTASLSKISVGAVMACFIAATVFLSGPSARSALLGIAVGLVPFGAVFLFGPVEAGDGEPIIRPLAYYVDFGEQAAYHLIWTIVVTLAAWRNWPSDPTRRPFALSLLAGIWAAFAATSLLDLPAGAAYYFGNVGMWLGLGLVAWLDWTPRRIKEMSPTAKTAVLLAIVALGFAFDGTMDKAPQGLVRTTQTIQEQGPKLSGTTELTPVAHVFASIQSASDVDGILLPPQLEGFWNGLPLCWAPSLAAAAFSERPLLRGLPPAPCEPTPYYGFSAYDPSESRTKEYENDRDICSDAAKRGMSRVLVVAAADARVLSCPADQ